MKRREFAKKHCLTYDTIRHYIDIGLLVPKLNKNQYCFDEDDSRDIETIIHLKSLDFTLSEIQKILTIERSIDKRSKNYLDLLLPLYKDKMYDIESSLKRYNQIEIHLKEKINEIKKQSLENVHVNRKLGFSLSAFDLLACPQCHKALNLSEGKVEHNSIINAIITCDCGYSATIEDSIFIDKASSRQKLLKEGIQFPSLNDYLQIVSTQYVNFQFTGMSTAIKMIQTHYNVPQTMLELNFCVGAFLAKYIHLLHSDTTYILVDYDLNRIRECRKRLTLETSHNKFLFICCDIDSLPLKKASIDIVVDDWMPKCYVPNSKQSIAESILPYLKENGLLVGFYHYIENGYREKNKLSPNVIDYYNKDKLLKLFFDLQLDVLESVDIGPIKEYNPYNSEVKHAEVYQTIYLATKNTIQPDA